MRAVCLLGVTVLNYLFVREAIAHPLCYYDQRPPDPDVTMVLCPQEPEGACCNEDEEMAAIQVYSAPFAEGGTYPTGECADYYRQVNIRVFRPSR